MQRTEQQHNAELMDNQGISIRVQFPRAGEERTVSGFKFVLPERTYALTIALLCAATWLFSGCSSSSTIHPTASALAIANTTLPSGEVGTAYSATLTATGGTAPMIWSMSAGTLPAGLSLSAATGVVSGTPTAAVAGASLTFDVHDSGSPTQTMTATLILTITPATLSIISTGLPTGTLGANYSAALVAAGGTAPYTWTVSSGMLPAGLTLDQATGIISGIPTAAVTNASITVAVHDAGSPSQTQAAVLAITINAVALPTVTITTASLPNGTVGAVYSLALAATGGQTPYTWSVSSGALPAGLSLSSSGTISGKPTAVASGTAVTFTVKDFESPAQTASVALTISIAPAPLSIATTSLPNGTVGQAYSASLSAAGGTTPFAWSITTGALPAGLSLAAATGVISGTPTAAVSGSSLTFSVHDSGSPVQTKTVTLTLTVVPAALTVSTSSLPSGAVGTAYSATLAATGGTTPYSWSITSGALPTGLSLAAATGVISGTPTVAVTTSSITFSVHDSGSPVQTKPVTLTLTIAPATLTVSTSSLPSGTVGSAYSTTLAATGGTTPYAWSITSGALPTGLSLAAATGVISGTPTVAVTNSSITFSVHDSGSPVQTKPVTLTLTIAPGILAISTGSLPSGTVNSAYSTTLSATGGTTPYTWSITSGALPTGLTLASATGVISGTPTVTAANVAIGFMVQDSATPKNTATKSLNLTVSATTISVTMNLKRAGLTVTQTLGLSATTNDASGVTWSISPSGGSFSASTSASGVGVTFTAPGTAGTYVITATSVSDITQTSSATIGVTDLAGVYTYHNDLNRDGANTHEYALTTANVTTSTFGKLFSCVADGAIYAQPLWVANLTVGGTQHNVVFVATEHDGLYAYDADTSPCVTLWHKNLIDAAHGGTSGESSVPSNLVGIGNGDLSPEIGVTGTPVIDPATNILYVVSKSVDAGQTNFYQRLHAIDLATGAEKTGSPVLIAATSPGAYEGGTDTFSARQELQRAGLALVNGLVYLTWSSHEDAPPYFGWVISYSYNGTSFTQSSVLNVAPNVGYGGIWMGGGAPAADSGGNLYLLTGNAVFDATNSSAPNNDYGDSLLQLSPSLAVTQYFTPSDQSNDNTADQDFGAGGAAILADLPNTSPVTHLIMGGGKDGTLYVLNRDALGGSGDSHAWQPINFGHGIFSTGAFWNNTFFLRGISAPLEAYNLNTSTAKFALGTQSSTNYGFPGSSPSVSATGTTNGLVWDLDQSKNCKSACGPAVLHAFDATDLTTELWNSSTTGNDAAGYAVKFTVPSIANGKVYVGTRGTSTLSGTVSGELDVYGLKPN
jgi:hypothetical protein